MRYSVGRSVVMSVSQSTQLSSSPIGSTVSHRPPLSGLAPRTFCEPPPPGLHEPRAPPIAAERAGPPQPAVQTPTLLRHRHAFAADLLFAALRPSTPSALASSALSHTSSSSGFRIPTSISGDCCYGFIVATLVFSIQSPTLLDFRLCSGLHSPRLRRCLSSLWGRHQGFPHGSFRHSLHLGLPS
ncbi:hypothetical protein DPX16_15071 [Anabarilius grahami]|uniref:Uncharacterized protein n=1 Tax=Anabarilius grahami TaxID=495550 RepID=A0A3N0YX20_ANAGA|nr:hypothetical protein DPX16_15071 [Anabarilius grahami]